MKIGVFDSGVGGQSVANAIRKQIPGLDILVVEDKANLPYGTKTPEELYGLVLPLLRGMQADGCQLIIIACNTVTTTIIGRLREALTIPLIGMEPMVKPAAERTKSDIIAVCATPTTLASERYAWLKEAYAPHTTVLEPDCSDWAQMIESDTLDRRAIHERIDEVCSRGADVIVLGCTHYHWIEEIIKEEARGRATVLQPEQPVVRQLKRELERLA
jgi:glutamate racemase